MTEKWNICECVIFKYVFLIIFLQRVAELNLSRGSPTHFAAYADMRPSSSASPSAAIGKSTSLSTIGNDPADPVVVDHNEIIALTHDVKNFSDTLAKLKFLFIEGLGECHCLFAVCL